MKKFSILIFTKNRASIIADFKSDLVREQTIVDFSMHKPEWTQKIIKIMAHFAFQR